MDLTASGERVRSVSPYHQPFWSAAQPTAGRFITPAPALSPTDEELAFPAGLIDQRTAWKIVQARGTRDGKGFIGDKSGLAYPAAMAPMR